LDGIFVEIGLNPSSDLAKSIGVETDAAGYVKVGEDMSTNIPGFFAAGDVTTGSARFMQLVTAASEGVIATYGVYRYLNQ
jgi:thioredoxin reductase